MGKELFVTNSIKDYADKQQRAGVYAAVDRFLTGDFGEIDTLARYKVQAIQNSFNKCAETALGVYRVQGIKGPIMVIFDGRFSGGMKELYHYENDCLMIIRESEFPYNSADPLRELSEHFLADEKERRRNVQ